jgi:hypothetical protein
VRVRKGRARPDGVARTGWALVGTVALILLASTGTARAAWTVQNLPAVGQQVSLNAVRCASTSSCLAVGGDSAGLLVDRLVGSTWSMMPVPTPLTPHKFAPGFSGLSCTGPSSCTAVGSNACGGPLAERFNGTAWSVQRLALNRKVTACGGSLTDVSCYSDQFCVAVGGTIVEQWNGRRWQILPTPHASRIRITSVSCRAPNGCAAGGGWAGGSLLAWWNGRRWRVQLQHNYQGRAVFTINSISCTWIR